MRRRFLVIAYAVSLILASTGATHWLAYRLNFAAELSGQPL